MQFYQYLSEKAHPGAKVTDIKISIFKYIFMIYVNRINMSNLVLSGNKPVDGSSIDTDLCPFIMA